MKEVSKDMTDIQTKQVSKKYLRSQERERSSCLNDSFKNWLSKEERRVDALALRADERRDKLR